jgi:hypothetical protein
MLIGFKEVDEDDVVPGTIVIFPGLTGVVTETAGDPLDATVVYPSAERGGTPNIESIRNLVSGAAPKFVIPENVINEAAVKTANQPPK